MQYADHAIRHELSVLCAPSTDEKQKNVSLAKRVGMIAGTLWSANKAAPASKTALLLWNKYRPLNVVAVPKVVTNILPKLTQFESPIVV